MVYVPSLRYAYFLSNKRKWYHSEEPMASYLRQGYEHVAVNGGKGWGEVATVDC
jgi:hypothetical protein